MWDNCTVRNHGIFTFSEMASTKSYVQRVVHIRKILFPQWKQKNAEMLYSRFERLSRWVSSFNLKYSRRICNGTVRCIHPTPSLRGRLPNRPGWPHHTLRVEWDSSSRFSVSVTRKLVAKIMHYYYTRNIGSHVQLLKRHETCWSPTV